MSSTSEPQSNASFPPTRTSEHVLILPDRQIPYTAIAGWQTLYEKDKPVAEMFHAAYLAKDVAPASRPITFVFNGGPGAASAFLHMGALGPRRVVFGENGSLPKPPVCLVDNHESWLSFSDLVFIDPIGTGFSRTLPPDQKQDSNDQQASTQSETSDKIGSDPSHQQESDREKIFWEMDRDLKSLGEFMQRFLSLHHRWRSPTFIAGESYGGFRVAKLSRSLQEDFGIGLSGAILISPALEFSWLEGSDYTLSYWASLIPSFAVTAAHHQRAQGGAAGDRQAHQAAAERFTRRIYLSFLAWGDGLPQSEQEETIQQLSDLIGLPPSLIKRHGGRIDRQIFSRQLLREERKVVGLYDASVTAIDPFPDRAQFEGSDPTLAGFGRLFTGAINSHLRESLGIETPLIYDLLNFDVFKAWRFNLKQEFKQGYVGAMDDLRVGMTLNPFMQVSIAHGLFDLVTTYFATDHLVGLMKLEPESRVNLTLNNYLGGHMFYTWDSSRKQWFDQMMRFYQRAIG